MLVFGLGFPPHRAVCVSMIAVGAMASVHAIQKLRARQVELRTGWIVAMAGLPIWKQPKPAALEAPQAANQDKRGQQKENNGEYLLQTIAREAFRGERLPRAYGAAS